MFPFIKAQVTASSQTRLLRMVFKSLETLLESFHLSDFNEMQFNSIQFNSILYLTLYKIFTRVYVGRKIKYPINNNYLKDI